MTTPRTTQVLAHCHVCAATTPHVIQDDGVFRCVNCIHAGAYEAPLDEDGEDFEDDRNGAAHLHSMFDED